MQIKVMMLVAAALASSRVAQAQDAAAPRPVVVLPEVTVSASRVERDSMDLPVSIDSIDQRTIREGNAQVNLSEVLGRVPGIAVQNRQNYAQDLQISSRGFGARAAFGVRGVRLIADGIPATMPDGQGQAASFDLASAQRIEVMRGPFSSLYGNASGGVVQIFTADGPANPTVSASALAGSHGTSKLGAQYGGQHGPLNLLVGGSRFESDGYRDHSGVRRDQVNAKLKYELGSSGTVTLIANALDQPETRDPLGLTAAQVAQNRRQAGTGAYAFNTRKSVAQSQAGLTWDLPLAGGDALHARVYLGDRQVTQYLAIPVAAQAAATSSGGVVDLDRAFGGLGLRWTRDTRLAERRLTVSVGVDYDRQSERRLGLINNNGVAGARKRDEDNQVSNTDFYAQAEWQALPRVGILAGVRHSRVRFDSRDQFIAAGNPDDSGAVDFARMTPSAGVIWRVTPLINVYANAGRGFETPTFAELAYRPGGATGLNFALKPADSLHREVGVKALTGDSGMVNLALFRISVDDEIVVNGSSGGRTDFKNAAGTRREGIELAWRQKYSHGFETALAWTLLDATFRDSFSSGSPAVTVQAGNRLPGVARSLAFAEAVWRHVPSGFFAGAEVRQSGKVFVNDQNSESAPGYVVGNLRAGFLRQGKGWRLNGFVRVDNITGREYLGSVIVGETNRRFYEPAPGRTATVGATLELSR